MAGDYQILDWRSSLFGGCVVVVVGLFLGLGLSARAGRPVIQPWSWSVDREALPEGSLSIHVTAEGEAPIHFMVAGERGSTVTTVNYSFVFYHPTEGIVVIDPGYPKVTAEDPAVYPGMATIRRLKLKMGTPLVTQLTGQGIDPAEVKHLVVTHMHTDHGGGIGDFPGATLWIPEAEWQYGRKKRLLGGTDPSPYIGHEDIRFLNFSGPYGPFDSHLDLFSDGSLILLPTPGHTPGHLSVLVNLPKTSLLVTGDVAWVDANWQGPTPKGWLIRWLLEVDSRDTMDSLQRIHDWSVAHPELIIAAGHEPNNRSRLLLAPERYR
jgi:glyoxylase-like metal-dependent hydrolase (beta-lactamase superfamily II)